MADNRGNVRPLRQQDTDIVRPYAESVFFPSTLQGTAEEPLEWLVDGVLLKGTVTLLAGDSDIGKSFLTQQLLTAITIGQPWLGRELMHVRTHGVFYEDPVRALKLRQRAIARHYDIELADLDQDMSWICGEDPIATPLMVFDQQWGGIGQATPFFYQLRNDCLDRGVQVVAVDTTTRALAGNENDRGHVSQFVGLLTQLAITIEGAVLGTRHPNKAGSDWYSGSGEWKNAIRQAISLERPRGYDEESGARASERILRTRKGNYIEGHRPWIPLIWQNGAMVVNDVAPEAKRQRGPLSQAERADLDYRMLQGLKNMVTKAIVMADEMSRNSLVQRAAMSPDLRDMPRGELIASQQRIVDAGFANVIELARHYVIRPAGHRYPGEKEPT